MSVPTGRRVSGRHSCLLCLDVALGDRGFGVRGKVRWYNLSMIQEKTLVRYTVYRVKKLVLLRLESVMTGRRFVFTWTLSHRRIMT